MLPVSLLKPGKLISDEAQESPPNECSIVTRTFHVHANEKVNVIHIIINIPQKIDVLKENVKGAYAKQ